GPGRRAWRRRDLRLLGAAWTLFVCAALIWWWPAGRAAHDAGSFRILVYRDDLDKVVSMPLQQYLEGVVGAEMPASFALEALKAQAVAARTLVAYRLAGGLHDDAHPDALVSTDYRTGQAWRPAAWWQAAEHSLAARKIDQAVQATAGEIVTYQGRPIMPAFFSSSGGRTEDSGDYWQESLPYLKSVADPFDAGSPYAQTETVISVAQAAAKLGLTPAQAGLLRVVRRDGSGRVAQVSAGSKRFTGRAVREALGLRSNWFSVTRSGDVLHFTVRGNGHGVGMPQYGADHMAEKGYTYRDILRYYYTGVEISRWQP
ncbi:MAG TPA: stage II sporulation protein D, partial [Limnochordia bacterium]|nr:stage II sporulation protein D [Limnochordia bacterium]